MKPKKIPEVISEEDFKECIYNYYHSKPCKNRLRDCCIFYLMFYLGLRPKEAKDIKINHIDYEKNELYIPAENNKQRNQDTLPIEHVINIFKKPFSDDYFFGKVDRSILIKAFKVCFKKLLKISYVDSSGNPRYNLSLYSLRHSFATNAYLKLRDIPKVSVLVRHYDFQYRTTLRYCHTANKSQRFELFEEIYSENEKMRKELI